MLCCAAIFLHSWLSAFSSDSGSYLKLQVSERKVVHDTGYKPAFPGFPGFSGAMWKKSVTWTCSDEGMDSWRGISGRGCKSVQHCWGLIRLIAWVFLDDWLDPSQSVFRRSSETSDPLPWSPGSGDEGHWERSLLAEGHKCTVRTACHTNRLALIYSHAWAKRYVLVWNHNKIHLTTS